MIVWSSSRELIRLFCVVLIDFLFLTLGWRAADSHDQPRDEQNRCLAVTPNPGLIGRPTHEMFGQAPVLFKPECEDG